jgi:MFS family permease
VLVHLHSHILRILLLWPGLMFVNMAKNFITALTFTASIIMVNNSVEDEHLGTVNGLGQSLGALARSLGPALGGLLWSVGTRYNFVYLNFIVIGLAYGVNYYVSSILPRSLDFKKKHKVK